MTRVYEVEVAYEFAPGGAREIVVPQSSKDLTVIELSTDPQLLAERFDGDERVLIVPDGTRHLLVTCRYRIFGGRDRQDPFAAAPSPRELFPGATDVRFVGM